MSYLVLARKWRPMDFGDLIGQDHVARTLGNAIASNRVAHAFLFTGVRGVGKTTSARILAKALNCMRPPGAVATGTDPGPTASPCLVCAPCREIAAGTDIDVQEIDGASYNGVDEVRRLQDSLPYRPSRDRYKIIIVDEVHMLSQNAWNAFLKTLEEPPPHVKFIFATTEVHKVPVTILSRVQRFDFKLIGTQLIRSRLRFVLEKEGVRAEEAALSIIAREAAGSMRDAMSLLDQVIAWGDEGLSEDVVSRVLGVASRSVLHEVARALVHGQPARCLEIVQTLADQGYDMSHVARDLLGLLRDLVVAAVCPDPGTLLDTPEEERRDIADLAHSTATDDLIRIHQAFSKGFDDVVRSGQPRAALEMLLVKLSRRPPLLPVSDLVERLTALERRLGASVQNARSSAPSPSAPPHKDEVPSMGHRPRPREPQAPRHPRTSDADGSDSEEPHPPTPLAPAAVDSPPPPSLTVESPPSGCSRPSIPRETHAPQPRLAETTVSQEPAPPSQDTTANTSLKRGPTLHPSATPPSDDAKGGPMPPARETRTQETRTQETRTRAGHASPRVHSREALALYEHIVDQLRESEPQLAALLEHGVPLEASPLRLAIAWEPGHPLASAACTAQHVERLGAAAAQVLGSKPNVEHQLDSEEARGKVTLASMAAAAREAATREAITRARNHPVVREALDVLGARVREVKLPE